MPSATVPIVDHLRLDGDRPHLHAKRCADCGAQFVDRRVACARCGGRSFTDVQLPDTGKLRSYTIVHRALNVPTPYVSGLVQLDDGFYVKANVHHIAPDPDALALHMPVQLMTFVAGEDRDGTQAIAYGYEPVPSTDQNKEPNDG